MRFVSKSANLMLVLKQGFPGNHLTGTAPISGVYIKFQNGVVDVKEESLIDLMLRHPGFNIDYISAEEEEKDPFDYLRNDTEPAHVLTNINYGHAEKSVGTPKKPMKLSPEIKALLHEEAFKMAKEMLPGMMKEVLTQVKNEQGENLNKENEILGGLDKKEYKSNGIISPLPIETTFCSQCPSRGVRHMKNCPKYKAFTKE